jgi:predicted ester cyclase
LKRDPGLRGPDLVVFKTSGEMRPSPSEGRWPWSSGGTPGAHYQRDRRGTAAGRRGTTATDDAVTVMRRLIEEVYGQGNTGLVDDLVAMPYFARNLKGVVADIHAALSDVSCRIEETVVEGDGVAVRFALSGVHSGEFRHPLGSCAPTGNQIETSAICIGRVAQGKVVAFTQEWDMLGLLQQFGVIATPESRS